MTNTLSATQPQCSRLAFLEWCTPLGAPLGAPLGQFQEALFHHLVWIGIVIFIVQPDYLAIDPSHTVDVQGPPRAIYTYAPLGLQFLARTLLNLDHQRVSVFCEFVFTTSSARTVNGHTPANPPKRLFLFSSPILQARPSPTFEWPSNAVFNLEILLMGEGPYEIWSVAATMTEDNVMVWVEIEHYSVVCYRVRSTVAQYFC